MPMAKRKKRAQSRWPRRAPHPQLKRSGVNFGTYHHTTPKESEDIRKRVAKAFSNLLCPLYPSTPRIEILDAGCGLGFLTYVAAKCFPKARVTGVDLFKHASISGISIENAADNMRALGLASRASFLKHDLTRPLKLRARYDLVVSNLVFHNIGKKRFKAYKTVFDALKPGGFFVIGDLFPRDKADMAYFRRRSTLLNELNEGGSAPWLYKIKLLQKK